MPRYERPTRDDFPEHLRYAWDKLAEGRGGTLPNVFLSLGNNPEILRGYTRMGNALWAHCGLDTRTREIVILRTALLRKSTYEWHQHVRIGLAAGLTDAHINALHHWGDSGLFSEDEKILLAYVDALAKNDHPAQYIFDAMQHHFPQTTVAGVTALVGFYFMTALYLGAMDVETETPFVGWEV